MSGKQIGGIVCLVLAVALAVNAISSMSRGDGPAIDDPSGLDVSHAVGAFLPSLFALIIGLWLLKKPAGDDPDSDRYPRDDDDE